MKRINGADIFETGDLVRATLNSQYTYPARAMNILNLTLNSKYVIIKAGECEGGFCRQYILVINDIGKEQPFWAAEFKLELP